MKILVTGANSQLGIELKNVLESNMPGETVYLNDELDLTDTEALRRYLEYGMFTHVINCATYNHIDRAEEESGLCAAINTEVVRTLAKYAEDYGYRIIHISTDYVFDGNSCRPYTESDKVNPTSQYGASKRIGETSLIALAPDSIIIRTGWMFSPYGDNFVNRVLRLTSTESVIDFVADQVGTPTYALDLAKVIYTILKAQQWVPGVFNYSNEGVATRYDFAKAVVRISKITGCAIRPILAIDKPTAAPRPYYSVLNKNRIKATYGIEIPHWEESLAECIHRINPTTII